MSEQACFGAIDLHSDNSYVVVSDSSDRVLYKKRHPNDLASIVAALEPFRSRLIAIAVESTFNWYWLVDGLEKAGFTVKLVNTTAVQQYEGLKYSDDESDAQWLAHILRLGILPTGHIYPRKERAIRDLLRKRAALVRQRTANILSEQNLQQRNTGRRMTTRQIKEASPEAICQQIDDVNLALAQRATLTMIMTLSEQIDQIERAVLRQVRPSPEWKPLGTVWGIGPVLAMTILLETGSLDRFASVGDYLSYCRCVSSKRMSNGKKKGHGNEKNGNKYLAWAWVEAANFAIRSHPIARQYYQKKAAKTHRVVAIKALAHKLARASWFVMRERVPFQPERLFC